ncbi:MAG TPA: hypothetical protein VHL57_09405, partial [Flavobacteriales bacterium]|nr:hypothetical protein [Flavobacteriales bacterium]
MRRAVVTGASALVTLVIAAQLPLTLDTTFRTAITWGYVGDALPMPDGTVWFTGGFSVDNLSPELDWGRFLHTGAIDPLVPFGGVSGSIVPTGEYYYVSGAAQPARYFLTGLPDYSYHVGNANQPSPGFGGGNHGDIHIQADGKVVEVGDWLMHGSWGENAAGYYSIVRLNTDAVLDSTFQFRKTDGVIWSLEPLSDGRFLASGVFSTYEGTPVGRVIRLNADYSLDTTYHSPITRGYAECFIHQPDGKVIMGGQFVLGSDPDTLHFLRTLPDGALDPSFNNHTE